MSKLDIKEVSNDYVTECQYCRSLENVKILEDEYICSSCIEKYYKEELVVADRLLLSRFYDRICTDIKNKINVASEQKNIVDRDIAITFLDGLIKGLDSSKKIIDDIFLNALKNKNTNSNSEENSKSYILSSCDEWKSNSTSRVIGVFTNIDSLKEEVFKMFLDDEINWGGNSINSLREEIIEELSDTKWENDDSYNREVNSRIENVKLEVKAGIDSCSIEEIHSRAEYIMIQCFQLNSIN